MIEVGYTIICDYCEKESETTYHGELDCLQQAVKNGWTVDSCTQYGWDGYKFYTYDVFLHICPECFEKLKAERAEEKENV